VIRASVSVVVWIVQHLIDAVVVVGVAVVLHMIACAAVGFTGVVTMVGAPLSAVAHVTEHDPLLSNVQLVAHVMRAGSRRPGDRLCLNRQHHPPSQQLPPLMMGWG
jgi:hypothetical protein